MRRLLLILGVGFLMALQVMGSNGVKTVNMDYVIKKMGTNAVIIDVRSKVIYDGESPGRGIKGGHIPGAINIPLGILTDDEGDFEKIELLESKGITQEMEIITYCNTGRKSQVFAEELIRLGYSNVNNYKGSMKEWGGVSKNIIAVK